MKSIAKDCGRAVFPSFTGERVYMQPFTVEQGLPKEMSRWEATVRGMLNNVKDKSGIMFLTIDQTSVTKGNTQRRAGLHVDGNYSINAGWGDGRWRHIQQEAGGIIIAASHVGSRGFIGEWDGPVGEGGDCSHVDVSSMGEQQLQAGRVWYGNVSFLHEVIQASEDQDRTFVRIILPDTHRYAA